jgi:hypothetical protein
MDESRDHYQLVPLVENMASQQEEQTSNDNNKKKEEGKDDIISLFLAQNAILSSSLLLGSFHHGSSAFDRMLPLIESVKIKSMRLRKLDYALASYTDIEDLQIIMAAKYKCKIKFRRMPPVNTIFVSIVGAESPRRQNSTKRKVTVSNVVWSSDWFECDCHLGIFVSTYNKSKLKLCINGEVVPRNGDGLTVKSRKYWMSVPLCE